MSAVASALDLVAGVLFVLDADGTFLLSRGHQLSLLGLTQDEVVGRSVFDVYEAYPVACAAIREGLAGHWRVVEVAIGELVWEVTLAPSARQHEGACLVGTAIDVTRRVEAERRGAVSRARYETILRTSIDGFVLNDPQGRILEANEAYARMVGRPLQQIIGGTLTDLDPNLTADNVEGVFASLDPTVRHQVEAVNLRPDGTEIALEVNLHRLPEEQIWVSFARDVTGRNQQAAELRAARQAAEVANQAKSTFIAAMSHELRTPLNGLLGMAELLATTQLAPHQVDQVQVIQDSGAALLVLINDILDLSKIEAESLLLEDVPFSLSALLEESMRLVAHQARIKGLCTATEVDASAPRAVRGDPTRLRQILLNFLGNAIKFTDEGDVVLSATARDGELRISVRDTGIGIDARVLPLLFRPFSQADPSTTRRYGGTGLGLTISRRLAELMGGTIEVTTTVGVGSEFTLIVTLPEAELGPPAPPAPVAHEVRHGRRPVVLLAEDHPVNRIVLVQMLEHIGYDVRPASNGREAVEAAAAFPYDAILMDCEMPELDGYEATRAIRAAERPGERVPIIAITANVTEGARARCLAAGMDGYVSKPVQRQGLASALRPLLAIAD